MDVHVGELRLDLPGEVDVERAVHLGREPCLDAELGRAELCRLASTPHDLGERQEVALLLSEVAAEGAEPATLDAYVGEVDVAVDHVRDRVAVHLPAQFVRRRHERLERSALRLEQPRALGDGHFASTEDAVEDVADVRLDAVQHRGQGLVQAGES